MNKFLNIINPTLTIHQFKKIGQNFVHFFKIAPQDILIAIFAIVATLSIISIFTYIYFAGDLKSKDSVMNRNNTGIILLDRNNKPIFRYYNAQVKTILPLDQIPLQLRQAVISAEDKEFYHHPGFSPKAIIGALFADLKNKKSDYGGSTITQQLVKISLLNSSKSFLRKYQELILSQELERRYSKNEILEMYLNSVYFGEGSFGIEQASQTYFKKSAKDLNLTEASILAGLLTAPSQLSPISGNITKAKSRQAFILSEMVDEKYITPEQKDQALNHPLEINKTANNFSNQAPHFAIMVKDKLEQEYGAEKIARSGFVVKTTLDLDFQQFAEKTVALQVDKLSSNKVQNGAAVVIDPKTGEVRALVGSKDWNDEKFGKYNITTANRQPGSSFKPIVYAAGLEKKIITPATVLHDSPITYKPGPGIANSPYSPKDYDGKFRGNVLVRRALVNSLNIPAVEVESKVGIPTTLEMAKRLGITSLQDPENYGLSLALGSGDLKLIELTNAYATFANQGKKNDITFYTEIKDKQNQVIVSHTPHPQQVLDPGVAFQLSSILSDNTTRAEVFGNVLNISRPAAVKTGTTENYRDSLTVGFTPSVTVGVWVGNNDNTQMDQVAGAIGAAPIWKALVEEYSKNLPMEKFIPPDDINMVAICKSNGLKLKETYSTTSAQEYFLKGTEPKAFCTPEMPKSDGEDKPIEVSNPPSDAKQGGWYPVGENGKALQFWDGKWFEKPQQEKKK